MTTFISDKKRNNSRVSLFRGSLTMLEPYTGKQTLPIPIIGFGSLGA